MDFTCVLRDAVKHLEIFPALFGPGGGGGWAIEERRQALKKCTFALYRAYRCALKKRTSRAPRAALSQWLPPFWHNFVMTLSLLKSCFGLNLGFQVVLGMQPRFCLGLLRFWFLESWVKSLNIVEIWKSSRDEMWLCVWTNENDWNPYLLATLSDNRCGALSCEPAFPPWNLMYNSMLIFAIRDPKGILLGFSGSSPERWKRGDGLSVIFYRQG